MYIDQKQSKTPYGALGHPAYSATKIRVKSIISRKLFSITKITCKPII